MPHEIGHGAAFCQQYCGYHLSYRLKNGKRIYYAFSGIPVECMDGCSPPGLQTWFSKPSPDTAVEAVISTIAHEIVETVSDPWSDGVRAWNDGNSFF